MRNKSERIPVQKGPINAAERTSKSMTQQEIVDQDYRWQVGRRDGQILKYHEPKQ